MPDTATKKCSANNIPYSKVLGWRLSDFRVGEPLASNTWTEFHRWIFLCNFSCFLSSRTSAFRCFFSARNLCFSAFKNLLSICFWSLQGERTTLLNQLEHSFSQHSISLKGNVSWNVSYFETEYQMTLKEQLHSCWWRHLELPQQEGKDRLEYAPRKSKLSMSTTHLWNKILSFLLCYQLSRKIFVWGHL